VREIVPYTINLKYALIGISLDVPIVLPETGDTEVASISTLHENGKEIGTILFFNNLTPENLFPATLKKGGRS
jgi:hypothetical protein